MEGFCCHYCFVEPFSASLITKDVQHQGGISWSSERLELAGGMGLNLFIAQC